MTVKILALFMFYFVLYSLLFFVVIPLILPLHGGYGFGFNCVTISGFGMAGLSSSVTLFLHN